MNYLVPIDFSDYSKAAAEYAAGLSKIWNGKVHLSHVIVPIEDEPSYLPVRTLSIKENTVFEFVNYQESIRRKFGFQPSFDMMKGTLPGQILKTARAEKADLIVMGAQGISGLKKHLYGSNAMSIIEDSHLPVLVVSNSKPFKPYNHIAFATSFDFAEMDSIKSLLKVARKTNASFSLVAVNTAASRELIDSFAEQVNEAASSVEVNFTFRENFEGTAEGLLEFVKQNPVDLLAVKTSDEETVKRIAGRSLQTDFTFTSEVPVLFLPL